MANNLPFMPLFVDDFDNDPEVQYMSQEVEGLYLRLLRCQWREEDLPADPKRLRILCRHHAECFDRNWQFLAHLFPEVEGGKLQNPRLAIERKRAMEGATARSERASRAAKARWPDKKDEDAKPEPKPTPKPKAPAARINWDLIKQVWNARKPKSVGKLLTITDGRKEKWCRRIQSTPDLLNIIRSQLPVIADAVAESNWFSFDWILRNDTNCAKFAEGKYKVKGNGAGASGDLEWIGKHVQLLDGRGPIRITSASGEKLWGKLKHKDIEFTISDVEARV